MQIQCTPVVVELAQPLRYNLAGVCMACLRRGCVNEWCAAMMAHTTWIICPDCDGTMWTLKNDLPCPCKLGLETHWQSLPDAVAADLKVRGVVRPELSGDTPAEAGAAGLPVPVSVPPAMLTVSLPRCLGCGQRTATAHRDCYSQATSRGTWWPCDICCGLRLDADGVECQECCGAGFIPELGTRTLAEMAGDVPPWSGDSSPDPDPIADTASPATPDTATGHDPGYGWGSGPVSFTPAVPGVSPARATWPRIYRPDHRTGCECGECQEFTRKLDRVMAEMERS